MITTINFTLPGKPIAKQRVRFGPRGCYNPQVDIMNQTKLLISNKLPELFTMIKKKIPVIVNFMFFFEPTKSQKTEKFIALISNESYHYLKKSDLDNLFKFYTDIMSGIIYHDDNQIYKSEMSKYYSLNPRTEIEVIY